MNIFISVASCSIKIISTDYLYNYCTMFCKRCWAQVRYISLYTVHLNTRANNITVLILFKFEVKVNRVWYSSYIYLPWHVLIDLNHPQRVSLHINTSQRLLFIHQCNFTLFYILDLDVRIIQ
jgi:hypothetical protein